MQDEEKEYQEFFAKAMHAGQKFANDYNNLSLQNKLRFQQDMKSQASFNALLEIIKFIMSN